jgi:hypothetical protein
MRIVEVVDVGGSNTDKRKGAEHRVNVVVCHDGIRAVTTASRSNSDSGMHSTARLQREECCRETSSVCVSADFMLSNLIGKLFAQRDEWSHHNVPILNYSEQQ